MGRFGISDHVQDAVVEWWGDRVDPFVTWDEIVNGLVAQGAVARGSGGVIPNVTMTEQRAIGKALRDLGWRQQDRGSRSTPRKVWLPPPTRPLVHP